MIGIDTVNIERLRTTLERSPGLETRLFSAHERSYCRAKVDPVLHLAGTLAAKEAVIKARGLGPLAAWGRRIEIRRRADGAPVAKVHGADHGPIHLSISHDGPVAVAVAFAPPSGVTTVGMKTTNENDYRRSVDGLRPNENLRRYLAGEGRPSAAARTALVAGSALDAGTDYP